MSPRKSFLHYWAYALVVLVICFGGYFVFAEILTDTTSVEIPAGLSRLEVSNALGAQLEWAEEDQRAFAVLYAQLQWAAFNGELIDTFAKRFSWGKTELEIFSTNSTSYLQPEYDFLGELYVPGTYVIPKKATQPEIAALFIEKVRAAGGNDLHAYISKTISDEEAAKVISFIKKEMKVREDLSGEEEEIILIRQGVADDEHELRPDLVPLPARDLHIEKKADSTILRFSTIYYNKGKGPLELIADPKTIGTREDAERDVFQRIYKDDETYRDVVVGNFLWHQTHLHYHFADFVIYDIEPVDAPGAPDLSGVRTKSTFCVRDVSNVDIELENRPKDAEYKICGQRKQGLSVGWGDTYFYTYPDQTLDISDLPTGTYRLSFDVNPLKFLVETDLSNNQSSALFYYDKKKGTVKVLEEDPVTSPMVTHVYKDQD